ncbi:MAG: PKD domain-containing protein [Saprospiraceae bacterium]|nr:PKD domain-containing protein [Saprospiraceae bacterium]
MKYIYLSAFFLFFCIQEAKAALPNGTVAPNWTLTDLNGNTHNLYNILNSGKHVVIDFSATWCPPCWSYHNSHALSTLWNLYGPNGSNEIMVFFIEGDITTNTACLYGTAGCQGGTQGNWVAGTPYPIIDLLTSEVRNQYQISYWPTIYGIRAQDKRVFEVGQKSVAQWESWLFNSFEMDFTSAITNNTCRGNGSVALSVTGGHGGKSFQWSNGGNTSTISNLQSGTFSCRITDSNNYFLDTPNFTVSGVPNFVAGLVEQRNISCNGASDGILQVAGSGGGGGYSYDWSNGESTARIEDLAPGNYIVTINDSYNCDVTRSFTITQPQTLFGSAFSYNVPCNGTAGYVELAGLFGTAPYLYDIGGTPQANPYFYNLPPGDYDYTVTDANNCLYTGTFEIEQVPGPTAVAALPAPLSCTATQTTVSGAGSATGSNITYLWTTTDGSIVSGANTINAVVNAIGTYKIRVTNTTNNCYKEATTVVQSIVALPTAAVVDANPLTCSTTQTSLDGSGSSQGQEFSYLWTTPNGNIVSGNTSLVAVVDEPGDYTLQVTNANNGCIKTTSKAVSENVALPPLSVTNGQLTCTTTSTQICGTTDQGLDIVWQVGEQQITSQCITVSQVGDYQARVTGSNGCISTRIATVTASSDLPLVAIQTPEEINCVTQQITITAGLQGEQTDFTIGWTTQNGTIVSGENTLTPVVSKGGIYTLTVVRNSNGCSTVSSATVQEDRDLPTSAFNHAQNGQDLVLTSNITGVYTSLLWNLGNGITSSDPNVTVQFPTTGTYNICLTATNDCGDHVACTEVLYIAKLGSQVVSQNASCFGTADGSITVTPENGLPNYTIVWEGPNGFTSTEWTLTGLMAGTYTGIITDGQGTQITITRDIVQPSNITETSVDIVNDTDNGNKGSVTPVIEGGTGNLTYLWSNGSTGSKLENVGEGSYTVDVTDENGCKKTFGPYVVENTVNANEISFVKEFMMVPNPTSDKVVITVSFVQDAGKGQISIFNAMGQLMTNMNFEGNVEKTLDISNYMNGLYTVEVRKGNDSAMKKLVVIH